MTNALLIAVGATSPGLTGYGGLKEVLIGLGVLATSVLLFGFRRVVQDKQRIRLREETPAEPAGEEQAAG